MDGFVESGAGGFSPGSSEKMSRFPPTKQVFGLDNLRHHIRNQFFPRSIAARCNDGIDDWPSQSAACEP